jgi:hypothetical protein
MREKRVMSRCQQFSPCVFIQAARVVQMTDLICARDDVLILAARKIHLAHVLLKDQHPFKVEFDN